MLLCKRYVDDINMVIEYIRGNYEYRSGKLERKEGPKMTVEKDKKMFEIKRKIGNEIHESIQLTNDTPSENEDKKVPILDLKCWVGKGKDGKQYILHEHYMKNKHKLLRTCDHQVFLDNY